MDKVFITNNSDEGNSEEKQEETITQAFDLVKATIVSLAHAVHEPVNRNVDMTALALALSMSGVLASPRFSLPTVELVFKLGTPAT